MMAPVPSSRPSPAELDRAAQRLTALLPVLGRAVDRRLATDFAHPRPPEGQLALLRLVGDRDGITVREAAETLLMKPNNVSALVSELVRQGELVRAQDSVDRRIAHLHLTPTATERLAEADGLRQSYVREALAVMTDGEVAAIGSALSALDALAQRLHPTK